MEGRTVCRCGISTRNVTEKLSSGTLAVPAPSIPPLSSQFWKTTDKKRKEIGRIFSCILDNGDNLNMLSSSRRKLAGSDWFDLPCPRRSRSARLYREVRRLCACETNLIKTVLRKMKARGKASKVFRSTCREQRAPPRRR